MLKHKLNQHSSHPEGLGGMTDVMKEEWHKINEVDLWSFNIIYGLEQVYDR